MAGANVNCYRSIAFKKSASHDGVLPFTNTEIYSYENKGLITRAKNRILSLVC